MKNKPSDRSPVATLTLAATISVFLLTACSSKPPGCADEQTVGLAKEIILDRWKLTTGFGHQDLYSPYLAVYTNGLKVEVRNIVSDGYNAEARKHACTGEMVLTTVRGTSISASHEFTSQATADGKQNLSCKSLPLNH